MNFILLLLTLTFVGFSSAKAIDESSGLIPLSGIDPSLPDDELKILSKTLAGARVVGLGEVSHGTQSDTARHRLAKYLVERMGYRVILSEYPMMPSLTPAVQKFLSTCEGDANQIAKFNYGVFRTIETVNFLKWICSYNKLHPRDPVRLIGADILYHSWLYRQELQKLNVLYGTHSEFQKIFLSLTLNCFGARYNSSKEWAASPEYKEWQKTGTLAEVPHQACLQSSTAMKKFIVSHQAEIMNKFSLGQYRMFTLAPGSLIASDVDASDYNHDITGSQSIRDRQIFENFTALWQNLGLNKKVIFMAHNYHVAKAQSRAENPFWPKVVSAGEHLKDWLKNSYQVIGITAYRVHEFYNTRPPILPTSLDSLDYQLNSKQPSTFLVAPTGSFVRQKPSWFMMSDNSPTQPNGQRVVPAQQYDVILYMRDCLESHPLSP